MVGKEREEICCFFERKKIFSRKFAQLLGFFSEEKLGFLSLREGGEELGREGGGGRAASCHRKEGKHAWRF